MIITANIISVNIIIIINVTRVCCNWTKNFHDGMEFKKDNKTINNDMNNSQNVAYILV